MLGAFQFCYPQFSSMCFFVKSEKKDVVGFVHVQVYSPMDCNVLLCRHCHDVKVYDVVKVAPVYRPIFHYFHIFQICERKYLFAEVSSRKAGHIFVRKQLVNTFHFIEVFEAEVNDVRISGVMVEVGKSLYGNKFYCLFVRHYIPSKGFEVGSETRKWLIHNIVGDSFAFL